MNEQEKLGRLMQILNSMKKSDIGVFDDKRIIKGYNIAIEDMLLQVSKLYIEK